MRNFNLFNIPAKGIIVGIVLACMGITSCKKILDTKPTDFLAPEFYFNNETELNSALIAVYDCLQKGNMYNGGDNGLMTIFNTSDEMYWGSSGTGPKIYNYTAGDPYVLATWTACYTGIQRANLLLANINKPQMDENKRKIVKGEAKFLRAFFYFTLVQNWGAVPLRTEPTASVTDVNITRTPAAEVYDFVIKEMEEAEGLVAPVTAYTSSGHLNKSAVAGMLARVCLFKAGIPNNDASKYAEALKWANVVISSGLHQLNKSYAQVFINPTQNLYDTKESLWEIEYYTTGVGDVLLEYGPSLGVTLGIKQSDPPYPISNGNYRTHLKIYNLYEKDPNATDPLIPDLSVDLRRDWNIGPYSFVSDKAPARRYFTATQILDRQPNKFDRMYELTPNRFQSNTGTNTLMLRYSDVLLMAAEAENEANPSSVVPQRAIDRVNEVRRRGYGKLLNGEGVKLLNITSAGTGYTTLPTITITGGGGTGATAVATVAGGKITSIKITSHGRQYTALPTITITGGGTGAVLTPELTKITDADLKPEQYVDKATFKETIKDERARELCFEGWRRLDLIRWGDLVTNLKAVATDAEATTSTFKPFAALLGTNVTDQFIYFPIPVGELSLNKSITQNPGW